MDWSTLMIRGMDTQCTAYIRISREGERSKSEIESALARYEATCRREAARVGLDIGRVVTETDVSGTKDADDRKLGALLRDGGVVIAPDVERFARDVRHGLRALDTASAHGTRLIFADDGIDTDDGDADLTEERFTHALMRGQGYVRRVAKRFAAHAAESVERGIHAGSIAPLGYRFPGTAVELPNGRKRFKKSGPLEIVPEAAARVVAGFECYADGGSWSQTVAAFGVQSQGAARKALSNRVYLGVAYGAGVVTPGAHPAIVSEALWSRVQRRLEAGTVSTEIRAKRGTRPLGGILRCAECGTALRYEAATNSYRCRKLTAHENGRPSVRASEAEAFVLEAARDWHATSYRDIALATAVDEATMPVLRDALAVALQERDEIASSEALSELRRAEALTAQDAVVTAARLALENAEASQGWHALSPERVTERTKDDPGALNAFLREVVRVTVTPSGRHVKLPLSERLTVEYLAAGRTTAERTAGLPLRETAQWPNTETADVALEAYRG